MSLIFYKNEYIIIKIPNTFLYRMPNILFTNQRRYRISKITMGCSTSRSNANGDIGPLSPNDSRMECSKSVLTMSISGIDFNYAYVSLRGYYPEDLEKENQDSYSIIPAMDRNVAFFAVYDGHGKEGHKCSRFVRDKVLSFYTELQKSIINFSFPNAFSCR